jgi:hypothetical protein
MANMELITSVTVGSGGAASVTLPATGTIPQTYTDLKVVVSSRSARGGGQVSDGVAIQFNGSTSNLSMRYLDGNGSAASSSTDTAIWTRTSASGATASTFGNAEFYIPNYTSSNFKSVSVDGVSENNATSAFAMLSAGLWSNTAAITSIRLVSINAENFVEGSTFYLYGISNVTSGSKATGGVVSSDGTYWYHTFPFSGTFTPTTTLSPDVLIVAGGGGGGFDEAGGGGAGGLLQGTVSSLTANTGYTVTVGGGGAGGSAGTRPGTNGSNSVFSTHTATGGGGGGGASATVGERAGKAGGSGGGGASYSGANNGGTANQGNSSPLTGYGNNGGNSTNTSASGGGGGGAGAAGTNGTSSSGNIGKGGNGLNTWSTWAIATQTSADNGYYAGGGGGTSGNSAALTDGGLGGGGKGGSNNTPPTAGTTNTGGGGGAGNGNPSGSQDAAAGGSGIVIIRYAI